MHTKKPTAAVPLPSRAVSSACRVRYCIAYGRVSFDAASVGNDADLETVGREILRERALLVDVAQHEEVRGYALLAALRVAILRGEDGVFTI